MECDDLPGPIADRCEVQAEGNPAEGQLRTVLLRRIGGQAAEDIPNALRIPVKLMNRAADSLADVRPPEKRIEPPVIQAHCLERGVIHKEDGVFHLLVRIAQHLQTGERLKQGARVVEELFPFRTLSPLPGRCFGARRLPAGRPRGRAGGLAAGASRLFGRLCLWLRNPAVAGLTMIGNDHASHLETPFTERLRFRRSGHRTSPKNVATFSPA